MAQNTYSRRDVLPKSAATATGLAVAGSGAVTLSAQHPPPVRSPTTAYS